MFKIEKKKMLKIVLMVFNALKLNALRYPHFFDEPELLNCIDCIRISTGYKKLNNGNDVTNMIVVWYYDSNTIWLTYSYFYLETIVVDI